MKTIYLTENQVKTLIKTCVNEAFNKQSVIRKLYKIIDPYTHKIYRDEKWLGVNQIIDALENAGYDVEVTVKDGGYRNSLGGNTLFAGRDDVSYWKEYNLKINVGDKVIGGQINASLNGTIDNPYSQYDLSVTFW